MESENYEIREIQRSCSTVSFDVQVLQQVRIQ